MKNIPLPFAGVALSFLTLGNILKDSHPSLRLLCGALAMLILAVILLKLITQPVQVKKEFSNPLIATSFSTFPMAVMLVAMYLLPFIGSYAKILWLVGIGLHFVLLAYVILTFMRPFVWQKFFASYFIPFVGFVVASVTAPAFQMIALGKALFYLGFVCYLILLLPTLYRIFVLKQFPPAAQPTHMILAAPASLCLAGYLSSFERPAFSLVVILVLLSLVSTCLGYFFFIKTNQRDFYPSFSAATFPFAISALAMKQAAAYFMVNGAGFRSALLLIANIEWIIAAVLCCYVLLRYLLFFFANAKRIKGKLAD